MEAAAEAETIPPEEIPVYVITDFEFDIKGRTKPTALIYNGEFKKGERIKGKENLEKYINNKTQLLVNQRVLRDNASVTYTTGEQDADGAYPVTLTIKVEDTQNLIALPKPGYSSNTGFELTIKARDYNFLGTMNPLRLDLSYFYDENQQSSFKVLLESDTPFTAFGYQWNIKFNNNFSYRPQESEPFYYQNVTGLSMELPVKRTTFTFGAEESFNVNEENADRYKETYGDFQNGLYMATKLYTSWEIPTGLNVGAFGELTYTPVISANFNHGFSKWPLADIRIGPFLDFSHTLGFEKIDWHANYRQGLSVKASNSYSYNFHRLINNEKPLSASFSLSGTGHYIVSDFFAVSSRLMYRQWFYHDPDYYEQAGDAMRGIRNDMIQADYMLSLNMDFPFRIFMFTPSKWLNNEKLRWMDLEFHLSPVLDIALYHDPKNEVSFSPKNIAVSGGLEFIVFPDFFRSFYLRAGLAWNLRELLSTKPFDPLRSEVYELEIVIGHFY